MPGGFASGKENAQGKLGIVIISVITIIIIIIITIIVVTTKI